MIMIGVILLMILKIYLSPHGEYEIDNNVCNNIESGFGRVSTLDPTYLENVQSYDFFLIKVGLERS